MSVDKFDKDIESLYFERKRSINAPTISFVDPTNKLFQKPKRRWNESLSILAMGGLASFCIFAIVNHLAYLPPDAVTVANTESFYIDVVDVDNTINENQPINTTPPTAKVYQQKTLIEPPQKTFELSSTAPIKATEVKKVTLDKAKLQVATILPNKIPLSVKPIYKVMPTYNRTENNNQPDHGEIKLTYHINESGGVDTIKVVESSVNRLLEKSAKKALSQWQFSPNVQTNKEFQIVFQFNNH